MIELRELSHGFLRKSLFSNVSLRLLTNERYGVVGANGCGKSTLLKIIAGEIESDSGEIALNKTELFRIGQEFSLEDQNPIIDTAMMGQLEVFSAIKKKEEILAKNLDHADLSEQLASLEEILQRNDGYRLKSKAETILEGLGIPTSEHQQPLKTLSGGYQWRVFLAQALVKNPRILLLDEPTNHLDIVSIRWLELFLSSYKGIILLVSHDKRFMDHVCTQILDIDFDTITPYSGNYSAFEQAKALFMLQKEKEILAQEKEIAHKQAFIDRFRSKASKARQAQSRIKQLERMEVVEPIKSSRIHPKFNFDIADIGSKEVLAVKNLSKSYGEKVIIKDLSFNVQRGDKVAIIGPNGSGKSTLIKALAQYFPECNSFVKWGHGTAFGYFAQDGGAKIKAADLNVLEWLWQFCADKPQSFVQGLLGRMLFSQDDAKKRTKDLSGGELSRLNFAYLMLLKPNTLLLDEPTNHLDLETIDSLTKALADYPGTLLIVSHDRTFVSAIAQRIIEVTPQGINNFLGTYDEFVQSRDRDYLDVIKETQASKIKKVDSSNSYEEQKKRKALVQKLKKNLEKVMMDVEDAQNQINDIDQKFLDENFFKENDFSAIAIIEQKKSALNEQLNGLITEWDEIEKQLSSLELNS